METDDGLTAVSDERLIKLELDMEHISTHVDSIKGDVSEMRSLNVSVQKSIATLTQIAEQNQSLEPKITAMLEKSEQSRKEIRKELKDDISSVSDRVSSTERLVWKAVGIATTVTFVITVIAAPVFIKSLS